MRQKFAKVIFTLFMLTGGNLQAWIFDKNNEASALLNIWGGDFLQFASLHVGATSEAYQIPIGDTRSKSGASVGVSAGVNYFLVLPVGARLRFMYSDMGSTAAHKSFGVVTYIHLYDIFQWDSYLKDKTGGIFFSLLL